MNDLFTEAEQEHFEERSGIVEFMGGESREAAEAAARQEVLWARDRFRGMVRQLLKWRASGERQMAVDWLAAQKNPTPYKEEANRQWELGSRGIHPDWRE